MTAYWKPGTLYSCGAIVEYDGARYKVLQDHRSQNNWTPPMLPDHWQWCRIDPPFQVQRQGNYYDSQGPTQGAQQPNGSYRPHQYGGGPHQYDGGPHQYGRGPHQYDGGPHQYGGGGHYGGHGAQQPSDSYHRPCEAPKEAPQEDHENTGSEEHKKTGSEERNKGLEIGGGILAGATALVGGYYGLRW